MTLKPDDSSLTPHQWSNVRRYAQKALQEAGALGVLPTPIDDILVAANVEPINDEILDSGFLRKLRSKAGDALKRALSKVLGVFDAKSGLVFVDRLLQPVKRRFVLLHEAGHGFLPWQRTMYELVEDSEQALDPEAAELFDREANTFASEVLFQLDTFAEMAADHDFEIWTPVNLSKKFNASLYASIRQYVAKSDRCCVVLVLNPPEPTNGGFEASLRRVVPSASFARTFSAYPWPNVYTPADPFGVLVPLGKRKSSGKRNLVLKDSDGNRHECVAESFTQTYQVFILIHVVGSLPRPIVVPNRFNRSN
ncbi:MAG: ImmA/IrrE family metallo-endopeptidase [Gammaproteobacteria bacterium]|nr:ImmA/IrrE family metallo-endopeptidase [Gammaproteobacteria bacterium]